MVGMKSKLTHEDMLEPIRGWLQTQGFKAAVAQEKFPIFIGDMVPSQVTMQPDVVGIKNSKVCIVEAETDPTWFTCALGKSWVWKTLATYVYIAYPEDNFREFKILEKFGIGLLKVSSEGVTEVIKISDKDVRSILELHPLNYEREGAIYTQLKGILPK
jgi:hypothetical protein